MRSALLVALVLAGCPAASPSPTAMPWLRGLTTTASSDVVNADVARRMQSAECAEPCPDYGGIELAADVATAPGVETILASYAQGLVILDQRGRVISRRPGIPQIGSADELVAVAVGEVQPGAPVIAIATREGGRREHEVRLELVRIVGERLETVFSAVVEVHDGEGDATGNVTIVPGGALYTAPRAATSELRVFGPAAKAR